MQEVQDYDNCGGNEMIFNILMKYPKERKLNSCDVCVSTLNEPKGFSAIAFDKSGKGSLVAELCHVSLMGMGSLGLHLGGFEPDGMNKNGTIKMRWQEWYCTPVGDVE
jgi:hypothetical protein